MKFDIEGRMRNMRLPDGRSALLFSIYEAVSNSVHAIEERFGLKDAAQKGSISIQVSRQDKRVSGIVVTDNGIGLNAKHLESFETCDTVTKADLGGRGVGRLVWLKAFRRIHVLSAYETDKGVSTVEFDFDPRRDNSLVSLDNGTGQANQVGTTVSLSEIETSHRLSLTMALLARSLCHHFFPYFIAGSMPKLTITIGRRSIDLGQYLKSRMSSESKEEVDTSSATVGKLKVTHVYIDPKIARELSNSILLTAQGRVVETIEIEKKFALKGLANRRAYVCVVRSAFLDEKADQERTSFKALPSDIDAVKEAALETAERFLAPHIQKVRVVQRGFVVNLLEEHPQLAVSVENVEQYVEKLSPSMSDEEIGKTLFTLLYRHEKKVRAQIDGLSVEQKSEDGSVLAPDPKQVDLLIQKVSHDAKRRLAEYTIKRHQIIQIARSLLRYTDEAAKTYEWEKAIHDLICPMGKMLEAKDYDDHNLWLIDDLLSYYQFFASDKAMSALGIDGVKKEPDLIFFNPFGFRRENTNEPIVIIEFKRPGDEHLSNDPIDQVLGYIEKLQQKTVRGVDGEVIEEIGDKTPFECIVICDLTSGARKKFERSVAQHPTPDGLGYYGFSPRHNASIRVLSYRKVFRDAELRNQSFFNHLGLLPQEVQIALSNAAQAV